MAECVFCKIANKEVTSDVIYEDEQVCAFVNIHPESPVHLLFIPKKHLEWRDEFGPENKEIVSSLILAAKKVAAEKQIESAYKLIFNVGKTGHISHIHLHLLAGWQGEVPQNNI